MGLTVEIADPRADPAPEGWAKFRHRQALHPFWDYELLGLESWLARNPQLLAVVRDGGAIVGGLCVLVCRTWRLRSFSPVPTGRTRRMAPRWAEVFVPLFSGHPACVFDDDLDLPARTAAIRAFERELRRHLGLGLVGVLYRAMTAELAGAIVGPGRPHRVIDPVAVLTDAARWQPPPAEPPLNPALVVRSGTGRTDLDPVALTGLLNRQRAHDDGLAWAGGQQRRFGGLLHLDTRSEVALAYLDRLVRRPEVDTLTYHDAAGTLVGFNLMIDHPTSADMFHWAAVPGRDAGVYADITARRVRRLVERGGHELTAGRGRLEVKERLGFGTRELHSVAAPRPLLGR